MFGTQVDAGLRLAVLLTAVGFMALEYLIARLAHHDVHDGRETVVSFAVAFGKSALGAVEAVLVAVPFWFAYDHRLFDFDPRSAAAIGALFIAAEFFYYWHHRASHRINWLWATHSVHHSATRMNLTAAVRLGWTGAISGHFLFYLPLAVLGFHPLAIVAMLAVNLVYQLFLHTELAPRLGPLEWVLNTPAHHRVHHASNESYLDRNFGGMLIIFDRLFGTFAAVQAGEQLSYGLVGVQPSLNPLAVVFGEWRRLLRAVGAAPTLRRKFTVLFGPPGPCAGFDGPASAAEPDSSTAAATRRLPCGAPVDRQASPKARSV